jgi:alpha-N-acetylgalactosaminidase
MKVDGCGPSSYYDHGYKAMGAALEASGRPIEYSCSWPAYINHGNESLQPFAKFIEYGCNGWRNWHDIGCSAGSFMSIIDHWGDYGLALQPFAGPGHWHDMVSSVSPSHASRSP